MDEQLRRLEREAEGDPSNLSLLRELARSCERVGWVHRELTIAEHVSAAVSRTSFQPESFEFGPGDFDALRELGPRAVPALIDSLEGKSLPTAWRAGLALGSLGDDARAALPALTAALEYDHLLLRLQARWALGRLATIARPHLETELAARPVRGGALLDALVFLGREAQKSRPLLEAWASEAKSELELQALLDASDFIAGHARPATPKVVKGPSSWCWGTAEATTISDYLDEVWSDEVAYVVDHAKHEIDDLTAPNEWEGDEPHWFLKGFLAWSPFSVAVRAPTLRLTRFDRAGDSGVVPLATLESPNGRDFTAGELFFAAETELEEVQTWDGQGVSMHLEEPMDRGPPTYFVACDST